MRRRRFGALASTALLGAAGAGAYGIARLTTDDDPATDDPDPGDQTTDDPATDSPNTDDATRFLYDGEELELASAPEQVVRGETDRPPGTELAVRIQSSESGGGPQPFVRSTTTTVDDDGTFRVEFDLVHTEPGVTFQAVVLEDGTRLATAPGSVTES